MNWLIIALIAPFLWAVSNFIDKVLISKYFKGGVGALIMYSCFIGFPVFLLIGILKPSVLSINLITAILIIANGFLYIISLLPYLKALNKADTSLVVPFFQTIPIFVFIIAFFVLDEKLSLMQVLGALLIICGAVGISLKYTNKKISFRKDVVWLILLSSFISSLNVVFLKFFAIELDFWRASFWEYFGFFIFGILLFVFVKDYRKDFLLSFKKNSIKIISLNALNEAINIIGVIIFSFATLLAPISLVWVINGFQPLFAFFIGIFLTLFFPNVIKESLNKNIIFQKLIFIIIIFIGVVLLTAL